MKKLMMLLGVVLFSASAFALNAQAPADEKCPGKAQFEQYAARQNNRYFIAQYILINLADPLAEMTDEQATPLAVCYASYQVKEKSLVAFVRFQKDEFRPKEAGELAAFADRVEILNEKAEFDRVVAQENDSYLVQHILGNMIDPMAKMSDKQAAPKAKAYATWKVNGISLPEYVRAHSNDYTMDVEIVMEGFADRVERLAK